MEPTDLYFQQLGSTFRRCTTNLERVDFFIGQIGPDVLESSKYSYKNDQKAMELRQEGNARFQERKYFEALDSYTASLAWAQSKEVAAFAFANRSAVLARLGRYRECLVEIERALESEYPQESKAKLVKRRSEILKLQEQQQSQSTTTNETIEETPDCIEIQTNEIHGRQVVAKRDIEIDELLLIEQPMASGLTLRKDFFIYCHYCNVVCYNLIPCDSCPKTLFCGIECKERAWGAYHKYGCGNLTLQHIQINFAIPLQITIAIMKELRDSGRSGILEDVKTAVAHRDNCPLNITFANSYSSYNIFKLLQTRTSFFVDFPNMEDTFKEVLLLLHEVGGVNGLQICREEPHKQEGSNSVPFALGLYLKYSAFNHSCFPNAFFYHEGTTLYVRALGTIKKGQQCFISYCFDYSDCSKAQRQKYMKENFYFTCDCRACVENWPLDHPDTFHGQYIREVWRAHRNNDQQTIKRLRILFIKKVRLLEQNPPSKKLMHFRHLLMISHDSFKHPRKYGI